MTRWRCVARPAWLSARRRLAQRVVIPGPGDMLVAARWAEWPRGFTLATPHQAVHRARRHRSQRHHGKHLPVTALAFVAVTHVGVYADQAGELPALPGVVTAATDEARICHPAP